MGKKNDKIELKYGQYQLKFAGKSEKEIEASIENLERQIEEKNNILRGIKEPEEREKLELVIKKMEQEQNNMSGYTKNKEKIEKIREYKARLNKKIEPLKQQKSVLEQELKQHIESNKSALEYIEKTLKDTKLTEKMSNEEYNNLLEEKENILKEREEIKKKIDNVQKKIDTLARGASKCDLAWKSLFNDKSWDEIHVRATNRNYTRKKNEVKEQNNNVERKPKNKENKEEKGIATVNEFAKKHPILAKIGNLFKNGAKKVAELFKNDSLDSVEVEEKIKNEEEKGTKEGRDAFIEELRRHVENDKGDKEAAYIEKHKPKVKTQEEAERD